MLGVQAVVVPQLHYYFTCKHLLLIRCEHFSVRLIRQTHKLNPSILLAPQTRLVYYFQPLVVYHQLVWLERLPKRLVKASSLAEAS